MCLKPFIANAVVIENYNVHVDYTFNLSYKNMKFKQFFKLI